MTPVFASHSTSGILQRRFRRLALTTAFLCAAVTCPTRAFVTQSPISFWPVGNVEWQARLLADGGNIPNPPLQDGSASWDDVFESAITAWNAIIPDNVLTLSVVKGSASAPGSSDGVNGTGFSSTVVGSPWGTNVLGVSISTWSGNRRVENDVLFNSTRRWNAYAGALQQSGGQSINDLRRVALHELGHSLGLNHPDDVGQSVSAVMNSITSNLDALAQDDIDGLLSLYGAIMPLTITAQPQSVAAPAGANASFSVVATGSELITYAWEQSINGGVSFSPISPTSAGFSFSPVILAQNGRQYRVIVSNPAGSVTSAIATLTVTASAEDPVFSTHPQSVSAGIGDDVSFSVSAGGSPTPTYQWERSINGGVSWTDLSDGTIGASGATSANLQLDAVTVSLDGNQFRARATNTSGTATSSAATLTVGQMSTPSAPAASGATILAYDAFSAAWQSVGGATGYRIDLSADPGFSTFLPGFEDFNVGNVTNFDVSALPLGTYYYRVRAYNAAGASVSSNPVAITIGGRLVNLSTRGQTTTVPNLMIAGFVVGGSQPKQMLIRAVGPTLASSFGLQGTVPDPRVRLSGGGLAFELVFDNWNNADAALTAATAAVGAFELEPGSLDAAALLTLAPGAYTAQVETVTGAAGIAIVEVYETGSEGRLVNISTRGFVGVGDAIIIPGTVAENGPKRLLVRAVGESLGQFGLGDVLLEDPVLEVHPTSPEGAPVLFTNDDWGSESNAAEIASISVSIGAFELAAGSKDAVLLVVLESGGYTFQVRGKDGATGVVIVEVYEVP